MKKSICVYIVTMLLSGCGMMFKNDPTPTKIVNNSKYNVTIMDSNGNPIDYLKPDDTIIVNQKRSIRMESENGSNCRVARTVNGGIVTGDILASLFVPFWPISIPLIWIGETAGGYLRDNVPYTDVTRCLK